MPEADFLERLLVNFGGSTPWLILVYMFIRWVWPDVHTLLVKYLDIRMAVQTTSEQQLGRLVADVSALAGTLNAFILGMAGKEARDRMSLLVPFAEQSPVSPQSSVGADGLTATEADQS